MADNEEKKLQSEQAQDDIRVNDLVKVTQKEAKDSARDTLRDIPVSNQNYWRFHGEDRRPLPPGIKWGIVGLVTLFIIGFGISYYVAKKQAESSVASSAATLAAGVQDLQNLDPQSAAAEFSSLNSSSSPSGIFEGLLSLFGSGGTVHAFTDLSGQLVALANDIANAENDMFAIVPPPNPASDTAATGIAVGPAPTTTAFAADLSNIRTTLGAIDSDTSALSGAASYFNGAMAGGTSYLALKAQVEGAERFLNAFIPWLTATSTTQHVLVVFENPSEMRPGGGFIGSYADVSISHGAVTDVSIHDVADVDAAFKGKIVPPAPLQLEETGWRPADGNWFFDYPTSASETVALFEQSGLYANSSTSFAGAIAVTPQVLSDLLGVTGPITVPVVTSANGRTASTTFNSENLIAQIQKIVQAGQAGTKSGLGGATYPKAVLGQLYQAVLGQLASSTPAERAEVVQAAFNWIPDRDLMAYFGNPDFESFAKEYGAAGDEYVLPQKFNGDYLAVLNTDVNSDKSEHVISQVVNYQASIGADGTLTDHLEVDRTHNGNRSPYWWYQTTNQNYMQLIVPAGTTLVNQDGGIAKTVPAPINYMKAGYSTDPLLAAIASGTVVNFAFPKVSSLNAADKEILSLWTRTYKGTTDKEIFDYSHNLSVAPAPGVQYQFAFERQSGAGGEYKIEIDAPLGYVFAENGLASFLYDSMSTPGRLMFTLTLQRLQQ